MTRVSASSPWGGEGAEVEVDEEVKVDDDVDKVVDAMVVLAGAVAEAGGGGGGEEIRGPSHDRIDRVGWPREM